MKRRVLFLSVFLATILLLIGVQRSDADDGGTSGRYKTVEIQATQYIWELVSNRDGRVICQVMVEHPNHPTVDEAIQVCGDQIFPSSPTPTPIGTPPGPTATPGPVITPGPTPTPFNLADFFSSVSWRFVTTKSFSRQIRVPVPAIIVNFSIPEGQQGPPFKVVIAAYEPVYGEHITGIHGTLNGIEFTCTSNRCEVPITTASVLDFWATSSFGDQSAQSEAALRIDRTESASSLQLVSLQPIVIFQDSCSQIWGAQRPNPPGFAVFPNTPDELNTQKSYQYLAGRLIAANFVNAKDCPGGGLWASGAPNSCGLEKASQAVIDWQNQYDISIWAAARSIGIPPRLIKVLIEQESQFWPGNGRYAINEFGLGQLNQTGADVALRWDNELFSSICNGLLYDCSSVYGRLPYYVQATARGGMVRSLDAECPTCANGIDLARAYDSIPVFARTLRSNCRQVKYILDRRSFKGISYEDLWKFTLVSYHSGYQCLADALDYTAYNSLPLDWPHVSNYLACPGGQLYVNAFWKSLSDFDANRLKTTAAAQPAVIATFVPTRAVPTPTVTPTPVRALSHISVLVYVDSNNNNYPEPNERVNGVKVTVTFPDGQVINAVTVNGIADIDLTGRTVGEDVIVALPELYRTQKVRVMQDGEIPVTFRLDQPVVPPVLP